MKQSEWNALKGTVAITFEAWSHVSLLDTNETPPEPNSSNTGKRRSGYTIEKHIF